jgi:hypothetical protein
MSSGSIARAFTPIDLNLVAGDKTTPSAIYRQIKKSGATDLYTLPG